MTLASDQGKHVAMTRCYYCGEGSDILLHKKLGDVSEFHNKVVSMNPCSKCEGYMKLGIIILTFDEGRSETNWHQPKPVRVKTGYNSFKEEPGMPNPFRTGGMFVISEDAFKRAFTGDGIIEFGLRMRFMFMEHNAAMAMGLFHYGMTVPFREAECTACKHKWLKPVEHSKSTPNLSGEVSAQCPLCNDRNVVQGPTQQPRQVEPPNGPPSPSEN